MGRRYVDLTFALDGTIGKALHLTLDGPALAGSAPGPWSVRLGAEVDQALAEWNAGCGEPAAALARRVGSTLRRAVLDVAGRKPGTADLTPLAVISAAYQAHVPEHGLRLRIKAPAWLHRYPWETLCVDSLRPPVGHCYPSDWLVRWPALSLVREVDGDARWPRPALPLRERALCGVSGAAGGPATWAPAAERAAAEVGRLPGTECHQMAPPLTAHRLTPAAFSELFRGARSCDVVVHVGHAELDGDDARLALGHATVRVRDLAAWVGGRDSRTRAAVLMACRSAAASARLARHLSLVVALNAELDARRLACGGPQAEGTLQAFLASLLRPEETIDEAVALLRERLRDGAHLAEAAAGTPHAAAGGAAGSPGTTEPPRSRTPDLLPAAYLAPDASGVCLHPDRLLLDAYASAVCEDHAQLTATRLVPDLPMAGCFVARRVRLLRRSADELPRPRQPHAAPVVHSGPVVSVDALVEQGRFLVIAGEGGSGKTELTHQLAHALALAATRGAGAALRDTVVPVRLRPSADGEDVELVRPGGLSPRQWPDVERVLRLPDRPAVLLADGVSEWSQASRRALERELRQRRWRAAVITTRPGRGTVIEPGNAPGDGLVECQLLPLAGRDVAGFLQELANLAASAARPWLRQGAEALGAALRRHPAARDLCASSPLLLHALVRALGHDPGGRELATSGRPDELLERALAGLVEEAAQRRELGAVFGGDVAVRLEAFLHELAARMAGQETWNRASRGEAIAAARASGAALPQDVPGAVINVTGLLRWHEDQGAVRFCHDAMFELLAAQGLARRASARRGWVERSWWRQGREPVLLALVARLDAAGRAAVVDALGRVGADDATRSALWVAARCWRAAGAGKPAPERIRAHLMDELDEMPAGARASLAAVLGAAPAALADRLRSVLGGTAAPSAAARLDLAPLAQALAGRGEADWREALRLLAAEAGRDAPLELLRAMVGPLLARAADPGEVVDVAGALAAHDEIWGALLPHVGHHDHAVRDAVAQALAAVMDRDAARDAVLAQLVDPGQSEAVLGTTAVALAAAVAQPEVRDGLLQVAARTSAAPRARAAAVRALAGAATDAAVRAQLLTWLDDREPDDLVRAASAAALAAAAGEPEVRAALVQRAEGDRCEDARCAAIRSLRSQAESSPVRRTLLTQLRRGSPLARESAAAALGACAPDATVRKALLGALAEEVNADVRVALVGALAEVVDQPEVVAALVRRLRRSRARADERHAAVRVLGRAHREDVLQALVRVLHDPRQRDWVREAAAITLAAAQPSDLTRRALLAALGDDCLRVRVAAATGLGSAVEHDEVRALLHARLLAADEAVELRAAAAGVLLAYVDGAAASATSLDTRRAFALGMARSLSARWRFSRGADRRLAGVVARHLGVRFTADGGLALLPGSLLETQ